MRWSKSYLYTLKETPADAEIPSHQLLVRGGYIRKLAQGIFSYGPLALRAIRKFEALVREELDQRGCVELLMPMVQPRELWEETGRWTAMGAGLLKFQNRTGQDFCLGATHEEVITDFVRKDVKSYRDLPANLYQIQTKYRDEIRPRFGLLRGREFIMKDAYSFDVDGAAAEKSYRLMYEAYTAIFKRLAVRFAVVDADPGDIGGTQSQEFHILAESGEDQLLVAESGGFAANIEVCPALDAEPHASKDTELKTVEKFATPGLKTIADLSKATQIPARELVKTMFFSGATEQDIKPFCVLLRGSDELNLIKLKRAVGLSQAPQLLTDQEVQKITGAWPGSCGPVGLSIPIYMDTGVEGLKNYIVGANEDGFHLRQVNHGRDFKVTSIADVRLAKSGDRNPSGRGVLKGCRGIEVGHIFNLGLKYSKAMNATFLNAGGETIPIHMGCYGIGISRTVQAVIEQCHDKDGILWPLSIAPYAVHICLLDPQDPTVAQFASQIYEQLMADGIEVLMDDRDERPGVKFKDADLLGMPVRINLGARGFQQGQVEIIERKSKAMHKVEPSQVTVKVHGLIEALKKGVS